MNKLLLLLVPAMATVAGSAQAAIATTAVETAVTDATTAGSTIGLAVLAMVATLAAFKWIRRAM